MEDTTCDQRHWALILGGSSGFGLAAAHKLSRHGMHLCLVHRDRRAALARIESELAALRMHGGEVVAFNRDATGAAERETMLDTLEREHEVRGRVRLLLHSIAFGNLKGLAPSGDGSNGFLTEDDFAHTIHAMGTSLVGWVQALLARGLFASDARVLSLTSEGNSVAWKGYAAVSAAKAALEASSRSLAVELARYGLRCNVIQAGVTDTPALRAIPGSERMKETALRRNPLGRLTTPEDVADVIYLLCRDEAAWINGALLRVDGGEHVAGM